MLQFSKLETTIIVLLTASVISVALFEGFQREVIVKGNSGQWFTDVESDDRVGGNSIAVDQSTDSQLRFDYMLDRSVDNPHTMLLISPNRDLKLGQVTGDSNEPLNEGSAWQDVRFEEQDLLNLDWMESVHLVARIEGKKKETFRFVFRNRIDHLADDSDVVSRGFNQGLFSVTDARREIVLSREQFQIPTWWLEKSSVDLDRHKVPVFTPLEWIELSPGSMATEQLATLVIDSIKFRGHYFPRTAFYSSVLGVWMLAAFGVLLQRSYKYTIELQILESQVQKANVDCLTGLLNRNSVSESMSCFTHFANNADEKLTLVMLDIDHFKILNDTYGHNHGDDVLRDVGGVILRVANDSRLTSVRWGGEEFLIIAQGYDVDQAVELAEVLRSSIQDNTSVTSSFGVCEMSEEDSLVDAIGKADKALYASKWKGRNQVSVFGAQQINRRDQIIGVNCQNGQYIVEDKERVSEPSQINGVAPVVSGDLYTAQHPSQSLSK